MGEFVRCPRHWAVLAALALAFAFASDRAAGSASLSASVVGSATIRTNDFGFFSLTITNGGDATAHNVAFDIGYPDNPSLEGNAGGSCPADVVGGAPGHLVATIGDLTAGDSVTCTFEYLADTGPATIHNPWSVSSTDAGSATGEHDVTIDAPGASPTAPFNDDKADAAPLASGSGTLKERTDAASLEVGEPTHAGDAGGSSVWFSWTPNFTGTAKVNTTGSDFDTLLEARDPGTNVVLAANDDGTGTSSSPSVICFAVTKGTKVLLVADGYAGSSGVLRLTYDSDPATTPCPGTPPVVTGLAGADETAPLVGDTLTGTPGGWFDNGLGTTVTYQWHRCIEYDCAKITGATSSTYAIQDRDVGTTLRLEVDETLGGATGLNLSDPTGVVGQPAVTHTNGRIFWTSNRGVAPDFEIYSEFEDGSSLHQVSNHAGLDTEPSATMDGTAVAWSQAGDLVISAADGGGLADLETAGTFPSFSPDIGSRLAFVAADGIHVTDGLVDDLVIPLTGDVYDLSWSPDGKEILFSYAPGGVGTSHSLYVVRADGRDGISPVTSSPSDDFGGRWSPGGTKIAFVRGQLTGSVTARSLYVMDRNGANLVKYIDGSAGMSSSSLVNSVAWSPDGTKIVYSRDVATGNDELFVIPSTLPTGMPEQITDDPGRDELPFWAPQATYFLDLTTGGSGTGHVTSSPAGINCTSSCSAQFVDPQTVTLTAIPSAGQFFTGWSGACSGVETCAVSMLGDRDVTATFTAPAPRGGGGAGGSSSFFVTVDASKTDAKPGDLVDVVATIHNTSATAGQSVYAFVATPTGTLLQGPPGYESGSGCISAVNDLGVLGQTCNVDYIPGGGTTHLRYTLKMATAGDYILSANVTARNQNPSNTTGYAGQVVVHVEADAGPPPPPPVKPPPPKSTKGVTKTGNAKANTLLGTARNDTLRGLGGNDVLRGLGGNDLLLGGAGNDKLYGGAGNDQLLGGPGKDLLYGDAGNDTISARDGAHDTIHCGVGRDTVIADKIDTVSRDCEVVRRK
ncbi:MAG TPA: hypothetical protein VGI77_01035 [Gaiellaceae bacterium]|jgi:hypothetical protein